MSTSALLTAIALQGVALSAIMAFAWAVERRTGNSGFIDTLWTWGVGLTAAVFALWGMPGQPVSERQWLVAAMVAAWAGRLGLHILQRSLKRAEDPRYGDLKRQWGPDASRQMFLLLQKQALVALPLTVSVFVAAHNPAPGLAPQGVLAFSVFAAALAGEAIADRQLRAFTADPANRGQICTIGLWRTSRHPNYFFEWMVWLAYPIAAIDFSGAWPAGWLALLAPLTMYWLLVYVSGVPPLEAHMLRRHGERFRAYQACTNVFFPGPVKHV